MVSRGDIWLVLPDDSGAGDGAEPCVVLSPPEIHDHLGVVTVAPIAANGQPAAFRLPVTVDGRDGVIRLEAIRTVDKRRLTRHVGALERKKLAAALAILREMFDD
jgi:mRNA interferase MazF